MFQIENLTLILEKKYILENINLTLKEKKIGIIGSNGSGKSSFLKCLNGLIKPTSGCIYFNNVNIQKNINEIRKKVGFVFQNPEHQIIFPSVEEDLKFGLKNLLHLNQQQIDKKITDTLSQFHFHIKKETSVHQLSGGEKRILSLLSTFILEPKTILFDEPTAFLDLSYKHFFSQLLEQLSQQIILVTHDLELLENFERVLLFENGKIIYDDKSQNTINYYKKKVKNSDLESFLIQ